MAIDMSKLAKTANDINARMARGRGPTMKIWRPSDGTNLVRILPAWTDEGDHAGCFWREVHQHWGVGGDSGGPVICTEKTPDLNQPCEVCALLRPLEGRKSDLEAQNLVKDLRAKVAYMMSVIDMRDAEYTAKDVAAWKADRPDSECPYAPGDVKVQLFAASTTVYQAIANIVIANQMDITDLAEGHNVIISKAGRGLQVKYTVSPEIRKSACALPAGYTLPDLSQWGRIMEAADLKALIAQGPGAGYAAALPSPAKSTPADTSMGNANAAWGMGTDDDDIGADMRSALLD